MDDLTSCLSKIIRLCIESSIFLNQLHKFEYQLSKLYSLHHVSSTKFFAILDRFIVTNQDLNVYYKNHFSKIYTTAFKYLSRRHFTLNCSNETIHDILNDLHHLDSYLNLQTHCYRDIVYYIHKISVICSILIQYSRSCTNMELADRFVCIRYDLLTYLKKLNGKVKSLLIQINLNLERRKRSVTHYSNANNNNNSNHTYCSKINITMPNLLRTIVLWLIIISLVGYNIKWLLRYENKPRASWLL